jgi:hypothetical protein
MHSALFALLVQITLVSGVSTIGKISLAFAIILWFVVEIMAWALAIMLIIGELYEPRNESNAILVFIVMTVTCMFGTVIVGGDILGSPLAALRSFEEFCSDHVIAFMSNAYASLAVFGACVAILVYVARRK